jgi:polygalacturonase
MKPGDTRDTGNLDITGNLENADHTDHKAREPMTPELLGPRAADLVHSHAPRILRTAPAAGLMSLALFASMACRPPASATPEETSSLSPAIRAARALQAPPLPLEPTIPPACITLTANKTAVNGTLSDADEAELDTQRIQSAINGCPSGQAVRLVADGGKEAFVSGPLELTSGVTLWVDKKTVLFASRNPRDFDVGPDTCGTNALDNSGGCRALINVTRAENTGVMGDGVIDGRGGEPMIGLGGWTWWDVAQEAKEKGFSHSNPRLIDVRRARNFTLYRITLVNSPKFHVVINADVWLAWGILIHTPARPFNSLGKPLSPTYARNTDGLDPSSGSNGVVAYSYISTGDDQIAIKGGNWGVASDLIVAHTRFGSGHGMSIGSETNGGVKNIVVHDLSIDGNMDAGNYPPTDHNGIRIKSDPSRGGEVSDVYYNDVCIRNVAHPLLLTPQYSDISGLSIPDYKNVVINNVRATWTPGNLNKPVVTLQGYDPTHVLDVKLNNVIIEHVTKMRAEYADVTVGPGPVNFDISGPQVRVKREVTENPPPNPCANKFMDQPQFAYPW